MEQVTTVSAAEPLQVAVVDLQMPFSSIVIFMVKWLVASI